ncbi:hypothetical protein AVEN_107734-1 [Araneus ventricosus]|uniref:Uncharacterized protein n=1 Tax=Araneus ventricosus TaxID=182803 RepID=A0A4Y2IYF8_ARAVE|nr:hypothetical protein AVEN_107734-1 [Araneus ventricosus]
MATSLQRENRYSEFKEIHNLVRHWYILLLHVVTTVVEAIVPSVHQQIKTVIGEISVMAWSHAKDYLLNFGISSEMPTSQDNVPIHNSQFGKTFLAKYGIPIAEHKTLPYNLTRRDFFLFPMVKSALKSTIFEIIDVVKAKATEVMKGLSESDPKHCFTVGNSYKAV